MRSWGGLAAQPGQRLLRPLFLCAHRAPVHAHAAATNKRARELSGSESGPRMRAAGHGGPADPAPWATCDFFFSSVTARQNHKASMTDGMLYRSPHAGEWFE